MQFKKYWFPLTVILLLLIYFFKAFSTNFFADDFMFLEQSRVNTLSDILHFFIPQQRFFRPVGTELLYALLYYPKSALLGHIITFIVFMTGCYFLYKILLKLTKNTILSRLTILIYIIHFTHVYQLYWLATFQEVAMLAGLTVSLYFFINNKFSLSIILFIVSLFAKEQSITFPLFVGLLIIVNPQFKTKKYLTALAVMTIIAEIAFYIHKVAISNFTFSPEYTVHLSPKLIVNNWIWHFLWSLGFPSIMPDYFISLMSAPLPAFWNYFKNPVFPLYIVVLVIYLTFFAISTGLILARKKDFSLVRIAVLCLVGFTIFLLPVLVIRHKWMVRLTLPLIFISSFQSYIISLLLKNRGHFRYLGIFLISLYFVWNFAGVKIHEETSTYNLETKITNNATKLFNENRAEISEKGILYIADTKQNGMSEWTGSKKLQISFAGQSFLDYYFRGENIKAFYGHETKTVPKNAFIINPEQLIH